MVNNIPEVTSRRALSMQVCVPSDWSNEKIIEFAEKDYPCGTTGGWSIRTDGEHSLPSALRYQERVACEAKPNFVHIILVA